MLNGCFAKASLSLLEMNRLPSVKVIITPHDTRLKCVERLKLLELGRVNFVHLGMFARFTRKMLAGIHKMYAWRKLCFRS
jgi:hypothetical protein